MKMQFKSYGFIFLVIIIGIFVLLNIKTGKINPIINTPESKTIVVFVKEIKVANIAVDNSNGDLILNTLVNDTQDIARLKSALSEIENRPALKLKVENEEMINGEKALVMKEISVLKTDLEYIYAVEEALKFEFGFEAKIDN